tara:strand:- start:5203 stop:5730 length:528 start_codon:yes stop_codon:yes gene_type:complete
MDYHFEINQTLQKSIFLFTKKEIRDILLNKDTFYSKNIKGNKEIPEEIQTQILREINRDKHAIFFDNNIFLIPKKIVSLLRITTPLDKPYYLFSNFIVFNIKDKLFHTVSFIVINENNDIFLSLLVENKDYLNKLDRLMNNKNYNLLSDYASNKIESDPFFISQRHYKIKDKINF